MKIKFFKKEKNFKKGGLHTQPDLFWGILLCIGFVLISLSFIFGFFIFRQANQEMVAGVSANAPQLQTISKARIDNDLQYFTDRQNKSIDILSAPSPVVDPSL